MSSPYRERQRALRARHTRLSEEADELAQTLAGLRRREGRKRHRRVSRRLRKVRAALAELELELGASKTTEQVPRGRASWRIAIAVVVVFAAVMATMSTSTKSRPAPSSFDPSAIDGSDTVPRSELLRNRR